MKILEILKEYQLIDFKCNTDERVKLIDKLIKELASLEIMSCNGCKYLIESDDSCYCINYENDPENFHCARMVEDHWEMPIHEVSQPKDVDYTAVIAYTPTSEDVEKENFSKQYHK